MTTSTNHKLIIFDMDGTLADRDTGELLEGVADWFSIYKHVTSGVKVAIATNQGGVGLRHWMETGGFGEPEKYPTETAVWERVNHVISQLGISQAEIRTCVCFAYKSQKGIWSPTPQGEEREYKWSQHWRKPEPGMLLYLIKEHGVLASETLMVGDSPEDAQAAMRVKCEFQWAWDFFGCEKPDDQ
jgi:HAD superfamily hydrolase (TIGR01662 family)